MSDIDIEDIDDPYILVKYRDSKTDREKRKILFSEIKEIKIDVFHNLELWGEIMSLVAKRVREIINLEEAELIKIEGIDLNGAIEQNNKIRTTINNLKKIYR